MKHLYVCRHGESELNALETYAGQIDTPLTELGRSQARQAGSAATHLSLDAIVSSTLSRALETAQIIAASITYPQEDILANALFVERSLGSLEGRPFSTYPDPAIYTDIESEALLFARAHLALRYLQKLEAENVLLVSHGTFILTLRSLLDPNAPSEELPNAEIVQLT